MKRIARLICFFRGHQWEPLWGRHSDGRLMTKCERYGADGWASY